MPPIKRTLLLLAALAATLHARPATAGGVGVVVTGDAILQAPLAATLEGWLRDHNRDLVPSPLEPGAINRLADCFVIEDEKCARDIIDRGSRSEAVVYAKVTVAPNAKDGTRDATLVAYWFVKGHEPLAERRFCERCTDETFKSIADDLILALSSAAQKDTGRLHLTSSPAGARVVVDGKVLGITPIDVDLAPGQHTVALTADGHQVETRPVTIRRGETAPLDIPLQPGSTDAPGGHHVGLLPKALVGIGAAATLTGVAFIVTSESPSPTGNKTYRDTAPLGYAVTAVGVAALGTGIYLWVRGGKAEAAPTVALTPGGASLGWAGTF